MPFHAYTLFARPGLVGLVGTPKSRGFIHSSMCYCTLHAWECAGTPSPNDWASHLQRHSVVPETVGGKPTSSNCEPVSKLPSALQKHDWTTSENYLMPQRGQWLARHPCVLNPSIAISAAQLGSFLGGWSRMGLASVPSFGGPCLEPPGFNGAPYSRCWAGASFVFYLLVIAFVLMPTISSFSWFSSKLGCGLGTQSLGI